MGEWISVEDKMPEDGTEVYASWSFDSNDGPHQSLASYAGAEWITDWDGVQEVTHWMPLPDPPGYKEGQDG